MSARDREIVLAWLTRQADRDEEPASTPDAGSSRWPLRSVTDPAHLEDDE